MKKLLMLSILVAAVSSTVGTQSGVTGRWRALVLLPSGGTPEVTLDLKAEGEVVTGTLSGAPVTLREGRIEGATLTLQGVNSNNQAAATFVGQVGPNEIVFRATGLFPEAFHFVARRDTRAQLSGSVSDPVAMQQALKQFNVPGVSIADHSGLQSRARRRVWRRRRRNGHAGDDEHDVSGRVDQQARRGHGFAEGGAGGTILARSGRQHDPEIVEAAGRRFHAPVQSHPARS